MSGMFVVHALCIIILTHVCVNAHVIVIIMHVHVGIDDARNTAKLCYRMVRDGCRLDITKCIQKQVC